MNAVPRSIVSYGGRDWTPWILAAVGVAVLLVFFSAAFYNTGYSHGRSDGISQYACLEQIDQKWKNGDYGQITFGELQDRYWPQCSK